MGDYLLNLLSYAFCQCFKLMRCRSGAVLRVVHRKTVMEALAEELPIDTIRFSSNITSIRIQAQESSSNNSTLIELENGTTIKAKVSASNFFAFQFDFQIYNRKYNNGVTVQCSREGKRKSYTKCVTRTI